MPPGVTEGCMAADDAGAGDAFTSTEPAAVAAVVATAAMAAAAMA